MTKPTEEVEHKGYTIRVFPDSHPPNPRKEFDNLWHIVGAHRRYNISDPGLPIDDSFMRTHGSWVALRREITKQYGPCWIYRLRMLDHSGLKFYLEGEDKHIPHWYRVFDTMQVGYIFTPIAEAEKEYGKENAEEMAHKILRAELEQLNQYHGDNVWFVEVLNEYGEEVDTFGHVYGLDYAVDAGKQRAEQEIEREKVRKAGGLVQIPLDLSVEG